MDPGDSPGDENASSSVVAAAGTSQEPIRQRQHLVSAGYQRNFADNNCVGILDAKTGVILEGRKSVKVNWRIDDFLSVVADDGQVDDSLEKDFAQDERVILNRVRELDASRQPTQDQKTALDILAAIHLLRSESFRDRQAEVVEAWAAGSALTFASNPDLKRRFRAEKGRHPRRGELETIVARQATDLSNAPDRLATGIRNGVPKIRELLEKWSVQFVDIDPCLPGLVLADHPVLHGQRSQGRFGFKGAGAVGDADTIIVPIRRHLAACYCPSPLRPATVRTKKSLEWINSLLIRGAVKEVACHPLDVMATARLIRNLDRYPADQFDQAVIR